MALLVLVRHGQSQWNLENRFTGWKDVDITEKGQVEALQAGHLLKEISFDRAFTSTLKRAQHTLSILLKESHQEDLPITISPALNERSYGKLEGLNKAETALKYGEDQVHLWRRSYDVRPPGGESLADTAHRVIAYFQQEIAPLLEQEQQILIVAHGNSLRALIMYLEHINSQDIASLEIPTGMPLQYQLDSKLQVLDVHYLSADSSQE